MATLLFEIQGRQREITLKAFAIAAGGMRCILADLNAAIAPPEAADPEWVVGDLRVGSLANTVESRPVSEGTDLSPEVAHRFVSGMGIIEKEGRTPPFFSEQALRKLQRVVKLIGKEGTTGIVVADADQTVQLSAEASVSIRQMLKVRGRAFGSVEGRLGKLLVHGGVNFVVYHARTGKCVTCMLDNDKLFDQAHAAIGKQVVAIGLISENGRGEPMRILVQSLRHRHEESELPRIEEIGGSDPDFTGEMTTDEYIRHVRGG